MFLDDIIAVQCTEHKEKLLQHINTIDSAIKFTLEVTWPDGSMPFLDTLITQEHIRTLATYVCQKPTHIDQNLHWKRPYHIGSKYSVIITLTHRGKAVLSRLDALRTETQHIMEALTNYKNSSWALDWVKCKNFQKSSKPPGKTTIPTKTATTTTTNRRDT